ALGFCVSLGSPCRADASPAVEKGAVRVAPPADPATIPARYRLAACEFPYELTHTRTLPGSGIDLYHLTFPSPLPGGCRENNTVHAEYYRPRGPGPFPCVIVLDILAGNEKVARVCASTLAQNGIGGLFVSLPYYGPRRPAGSRLRFLSYDFPHSMEAIRQ